jgi:hypothetical protein
MARRRITVTQDIIDTAVRNDSKHCAVADALAATIPDASHIIVDLNTLRFTMKNGKRWAYITPNRVGDYIIAFDAGETIEPFTFVLDDTMRVALKRQVRTPAGKAKDAARYAKTSAEKRLATVEADPDATPAQVEVAQEKVAAAEQRMTESVAAFEASGQPETVQEQHPDLPREQVRSKPLRRTHKTDREFGRRVLRQNQNASGTS